MRVVGERRTPGVQHGQEADTNAETLRIGGNGDQRLGRCLEQQVVDHGLVLVGNVGDLSRQGEYDVEIRHREQLGLARGQPLLCRGGLAFWAVPVATTVVRDLDMGAVLATQDMAAERCRAAVHDRRHHLELVEAHMADVGLTPCRTMGAEDIRDLPRRA